MRQPETIAACRSAQEDPAVLAPPLRASMALTVFVNCCPSTAFAEGPEHDRQRPPLEVLAMADDDVHIGCPVGSRGEDVRVARLRHRTELRVTRTGHGCEKRGISTVTTLDQGSSAHVLPLTGRFDSGAEEPPPLAVPIRIEPSVASIG